jgi:predicted N-formylglutamate amidohydrolase
LVIDCNRNWGDAGLMPEVGDGTVIPANRNLTESERRRRWEAYHQSYHAAVDAVIARKLAAGQRPVIAAIHSMTPALKGALRPWQIAMCSHDDRGLNDLVLAALRRNAGIVVGDNEPYNLDPREDYSVPYHAMRRGLLHLQVEFRQDEVTTPEGQRRWAAILGESIEHALSSLDRPSRG